VSRRPRTVFAGARPASPSPSVSALIALGVPPAIWFVHLNGSYLLVPPSCTWGDQRWPFLVVTVIALAAMVPSALVSWRAWTADADGDGTAVLRFLGAVGLAMVLLFALTTLLVGTSAAVIGPCD
jgi:hypothetical protein